MEHRIKAFKDAKQFKELFGYTEHGVRKNRILLEFLKSRNVWDWCKKPDDWSLLSINSMSTLKSAVLHRLQKIHSCNAYANPDFIWRVTLKDENWFSGKYATDERNGICLDTEEGEDDASFIRYINMDTNKPYKMKAGKFYKKLFEPCQFWQVLPQQVQVWLLEELVQAWKAYVTEELNRYKLVINRDFARIYDSYYCRGDFGSCMTNQDQHYFYQDSVRGAKAAYLEDEDGKIVARCIIFTEVYDGDGNVWRLAERQYSKDCNELYKQMLVNALIKAGEIDGYKRVGAGCGDSTSFVDNKGESISYKDFYIKCWIKHNDTLSYQDSFKYYMPDEERAYNHSGGRAWHEDDRLDTTDSYFYGSHRSWDDYHDRWCAETVLAYYHGNEYQVDEDDMDDFTYFNGEYYHEDDLITCDRCGNDYLDPEYYSESEQAYSELLDEHFCCEECMIDAENEYKEENWFRADLEEDYVESKEMLAQYLALYGNQYIVQTFLKKKLNKYLKQQVLFSHNGVIVDDLSKMLQDDRICEELERMNVELSKAE